MSASTGTIRLNNPTIATHKAAIARSSMDKTGLEALLARIDIWLLIFGFLVVVGVAGESYFGIRHWWNSRKLQALQSAESLSQQGEIERLKKESGLISSEVAKANERAAEANRIAESERLARVKLESRMAWRRIDGKEHDALVAQLKTHAGAVVEVFQHGELEASTFADDIIKTLRDSGWAVRVTGAGLVLPPQYGLRCIVNANSSAGQLLADAFKSLPFAQIQSDANLPIVARIDVGLRPPP